MKINRNNYWIGLASILLNINFVQGQTTITNKGVDITNTKTNIYINGSYVHEPKASVVNGGTIYLTGDISNNSDTTLFITRAGKVVLNGNSQQSIDGNTPIHFFNLEVNKPNNEIKLSQYIQVNNNLLLSKGSVFLNGNNIFLDTAGVLIGENNVNRVYGNGLLRAKRFIDSSRARISNNQAGVGFYVSTKEQFGYVLLERGSGDAYYWTNTR